MKLKQDCVVCIIEQSSATPHSMHAHWASLDNAGDSRAPARYGHSLTSFNVDGNVYLVCFGGTAADGITGQVNSVVCWKSARGWHEVSLAGTAPEARAWHGAAASDHRLFIFGGNRWITSAGDPRPERKALDDLWVLDTRSWVWRQIRPASPTAPWPARRGAMGLAWHDNALLVYGGRGDASSFLGDLWMYNESANTWRDVTPPKRYKAPLPRVLATFVSTPYGVFIYGGARPGATPTARLPLCDLWHLKEMLPGAADGEDGPSFMWEDCNRMPMCSAEHAAAADSGPVLLRTPVAADRVVVGHDAHAWTFMEPSHIVVWSGLLGRMPKKSMLMPSPPPAQLTGNLFVIDVSAIERGWSMLPPQRIWSQHGAASRATLPRRWAAMAALGPGRVVVHGGLAQDKTVVGAAAVLQIEEAAHSVPPHVPADSAGSGAPDLISFDDEPSAQQPPSPASESSTATSAPPASPTPARPPGAPATRAPAAPAPPGGKALSAASSPVPARAVSPGKAGSPGRSNVMFSVLGGMRKSVETFSTEAVNVLSRVTGGQSQEQPLPGAAPSEEPAPAAQVRYSAPPDLSVPPQPAPTPPASTDSGVPAEYIAQWVSIHGSAASSSVQVLVPTTDRLTTPRRAAPPAQQRPAAPSVEPPPLPQQPAAEADSAGPAVDALTPPGLTLRISSGNAADAADSEGELESPVSLWISPGRAGPPGAPRGHSREPSPLRSEAGQGGASEAVRDVLQEMLDRVEEQLAEGRAAEPEFQFAALPHAAVPDKPAAWPPAPTPEAAPLLDAGVARGTGSLAAPPERELPTAFVQDMLMTDPVQALGLRVMHAPGATLEFVSLEEAKTELRRRACSWLEAVPVASCLRCKDVHALFTEYKRLAPLAMTLVGQPGQPVLGTLAHLSQKDLRMRDITTMLSEYKQLRKVAIAKR
eukprot:jgi/Ulvmu1/4748/UM020_0032.1